MWYFMAFLLAGPVQFGPFAMQEHCEIAKRAVMTYPQRTADGWITIGCWEVKP